MPSLATALGAVLRGRPHGGCSAAMVASYAARFVVLRRSCCVYLVAQSQLSLLGGTFASPMGGTEAVHTARFPCWRALLPLLSYLVQLAFSCGFIFPGLAREA